MLLNELATVIESMEFQNRYVVVAGLKVLRLAMAHDAVIGELIDELTEDAEARRAVLGRIEHLLSLDDAREYDESIAAYLYCLSEVDPAMALKASEGILSAGGVYWSMRLALHIQEEAQTQAA